VRCRVVHHRDDQLRADAPAAEQDAHALARPVAVADGVAEDVLKHAAQQGGIALGDGVGRDVAQFDALLLRDRREGSERKSAGTERTRSSG
jgi:hypothetical protein